MTLIVCKNCGHRNYDAKMDGFCGNCGKYLGFYGEEVVEAVPEAAPRPEPEPEPEPVAHRSIFDRVKEAVGIDESASGVASAPREAAPEPPVAVGAGVPAVSAAAPATVAAPAASAAAPAIGAASPVTSPAPSSAAVAPPAARPVPAAAAQAPVQAPLAQPGLPAQEEPRSRPPGAAAEPRSRAPEAAALRRPPVVRRQAPSRKPQEGDVFCGDCGEVNEGTRHFCRRCGFNLDEAVRVRIPWYRRIFNTVFRRRDYKAGERKKTFGFNPFRLVWTVLRLGLVAVVVVGALLLVLFPSARSQAWSVIKPPFCQLHIICKLSDIGETGADATSSIPGHGPNLVLDSNLTTYWGATSRDTNPYVHIQFATFYDVTEFLITPGPAPTDPFKAQARPAKVHLMFSNKQIVELTLADQPGLQHFKIDAKHVNGVRVYVDSTYPALPGSTPSASVLINEIEFQSLS